MVTRCGEIANWRRLRLRKLSAFGLVDAADERGVRVGLLDQEGRLADAAERVRSDRVLARVDDAPAVEVRSANAEAERALRIGDGLADAGPRPTITVVEEELEVALRGEVRTLDQDLAADGHGLRPDTQRRCARRSDYPQRCREPGAVRLTGFDDVLARLQVGVVGQTAWKVETSPRVCPPGAEEEHPVGRPEAELDEPIFSRSGAVGSERVEDLEVGRFELDRQPRCGLDLLQDSAGLDGSDEFLKEHRVRVARAADRSAEIATRPIFTEPLPPAQEIDWEPSRITIDDPSVGGAEPDAVGCRSSLLLRQRSVVARSAGRGRRDVASVARAGDGLDGIRAGPHGRSRTIGR